MLGAVSLLRYLPRARREQAQICRYRLLNVHERVELNIRNSNMIVMLFLGVVPGAFTCYTNDYVIKIYQLINVHSNFQKINYPFHYFVTDKNLLNDYVIK